MDEVSSHVRLDPAVTVRSWQRLFRLVLESHDGRAPGADSEEKHEPVSDIDTVAVDSLKALDPKRPIREADICGQAVSAEPVANDPKRTLSHRFQVGGICGFSGMSAPAGRRTVNTDPLPGSLVTVTSPPIMRASLREMASPRPVPPKRCAVEASAWVNS